MADYLDAGSTFEYGDYTCKVLSFPYDGHYVNLTATDRSKSGYMDVPGTVEHEGGEYAVYSLDGCFSGCQYMDEPPALPEGVASMRQSFMSCRSLAAPPALPSTVTDLYYCFSGCRLLERPPAIPEGVTNMERAFEGCSAMAAAPDIPDGVTNMAHCFYRCLEIEAAPTVPASVRDMSGCFFGCEALSAPPSISDGPTDMSECFYGCTSLESPPLLPSTVKTLESCFYGCTSLAEAPAIPHGVTNMREAFSGCRKLPEAPEVPPTVENMSYCFYGCTSLARSPAIPEGVVNMGNCFRRCKSLAEPPAIPASVTNVYECFRECASLGGVLVARNAPQVYGYVFKDAPGRIRVMPAPNGAAADRWRTIASSYENVTLIPDDNPPTASVEVKRVGLVGSSTEDPTGGWALLSVTAQAYAHGFPEGFGNGVRIVNISGARMTTGDELPMEPSPGTSEASVDVWVEVDEAAKEISFSVYDLYSGWTGWLKAKVPRAFVSISVLSADEGDGVAFGKPADREGLDVAMPAFFSAPVDMGANPIRNPSCIEMRPPSAASGHGGYIDFHYDQSDADYTSRIAERASGRLSLEAPNGVDAGGLLRATANGNTVTIGSANESWCHFNNSADIPFYFGKPVHVNGDIYRYNGAKVSYEGHTHTAAGVGAASTNAVGGLSTAGYINSDTYNASTRGLNIGGTVRNANSALNGHNIFLVIQSSSFTLWDATAAKTLWTASLSGHAHGAGDITSGTLAGARLPVFLKTTTVPSAARAALAAGATFSVTVPLTVPSGYELVGFLAVNQSHNQVGTIGSVTTSGNNAVVTGKNTGGSQWAAGWTVTVRALWALANVY